MQPWTAWQASKNALFSNSFLRLKVSHFWGNIAQFNTWLIFNFLIDSTIKMGRFEIFLALR